MSYKTENINLPDSVWYWHSERDSLHSMASALRGAMEAETSETNGWRKLSHVRFVASMLQKYVERLFALEECGHLSEIIEHYPERAHRIEALRDEHRVLRAELMGSVLGLERVCAADHEECQRIYDDLTALVRRIEDHIHADNKLIQDAYDQDLGGESGA